jgi:DNA-binding transcriptional regulator YiaG
MPTVTKKKPTKPTRRGPQPRKPSPGNPWPEKLRKLRDALGLTQSHAAERAGVAARTWIAWENSQTRPSRLALALLKSAFPGQF